MNAWQREEESSISPVRYIERISSPSRVLLSIFGTQNIQVSEAEQREQEGEWQGIYNVLHEWLTVAHFEFL